MNKRFLFVCGCARSGTTAFAQFLNWHPSVFLGSERYISILQREKSITPELYELERFLDVHPRDTHYKSLAALPLYRNVRQRYAEALYIGDKLPRLCWYFDNVAEKFPDAKFICIVRNLRDVAASFKRRALNPADPWSRGVDKAIADWNRALETSLDFIGTGKLLIVQYEDILQRGIGIDRIEAFLDLDYAVQTTKLRQHIKERSTKGVSREDVLSAEDEAQIEREGDFSAYHRIQDLSYSAP